MRYVLRRVAQLIFVLVVVTFLTAIALRFLPGGTQVIVALKICCAPTLASFGRLMPAKAL